LLRQYLRMRSICERNIFFRKKLTD
jgi:hypothetical protein